MNQLVALRMLDKIGFLAHIAGDGETAVRLVNAIEFDLVIMDCQLPGIDGFDTTRIIRSPERDDERAGIPIIGVSAVVADDDREIAIGPGMDDYLTKPMRIDDLQDAIERSLGAPEVSWSDAPVPEFAWSE